MGRRIYLDVCCLNRPFDGQKADRVRMETEALKSILLHIGSGKWTGIGSAAVDFEVGRMADADKKLKVLELKSVLSVHVVIGKAGRRRAKDIAAMGFKSLDALHIACAEKGHADVLLTTDDRFVRRAERFADRLDVRVANPLVWFGEELNL